MQLQPHSWETDFYPVRVLGGIVLALWGCHTPAQYWIEIVHLWVQKFYPVLGLGSGERLLWHFQTPVLYWIDVSLRIKLFNRFSSPRVTTGLETPDTKVGTAFFRKGGLPEGLLGKKCRKLHKYRGCATTIKCSLLKFYCRGVSHE